MLITYKNVRRFQVLVGYSLAVKVGQTIYDLRTSCMIDNFLKSSALIFKKKSESAFTLMSCVKTGFCLHK